MNLTESDKDILLKMGYPKKVQLSVGEYYVKMIDKKSAVKELIGYYFAKALGIETAEIKIVDIGEIYCLSEDLAKEGSFNTISAIEDIGSSIYDVWELFEKKFHNVENLMRDFIKVYIMDNFLLNVDRNYENFGVRILNGEENLCILDHELILIEGNTMFFTQKIDNKPELDNQKFNHEQEISEFLTASSSEFIDMFLFTYKTLSPDFFDKVLEVIKTQHHLDIENEETLRNVYYKNYNLITNILQSRNIIGSKQIWQTNIKMLKFNCIWKECTYYDRI